MGLQKFSAPSIKDALLQVQHELGGNAVILDVKTVKNEPGMSDTVEVWAQIIEENNDKILPNVVNNGYNNDVNENSNIGEDAAGYISVLSQQLKAVHSQFEVLQSGMSWLGSHPGVQSGEMAAFLAQTVSAGLLFSGGISFSGTGYTVALIGPTGVGKSTTIGKLIWHFAVEKGMNIGVITADVMRPGAVEQIASVCDKIGIELHVAYNSADVASAKAELHDKDIILIDTPGGSQRNNEYLMDLQSIMLAADPAEIHLVISGASGSALMRDIMMRYAHLQPDQVVITKIDEAPSMLELFSPLINAGISVSYLGTGTSIVKDLQIASIDVVERLLKVEGEG
jgi:flagellar biosynthesis GTPase FlhF